VINFFPNTKVSGSDLPMARLLPLALGPWRSSTPRIKRFRIPSSFALAENKNRTGCVVRPSPTPPAIPGNHLPVIRAEFRPSRGVAGLLVDHVIADTGADTSALPWADCQALQLDPAQGAPGLMTGVAGGAANTLGFVVWVLLDGTEYECQLHADFIGNERILGRDVLNSLEILFRGPNREVVVNP